MNNNITITTNTDTNTATIPYYPLISTGTGTAPYHIGTISEDMHMKTVINPNSTYLAKINWDEIKTIEDMKVVMKLLEQALDFEFGFDLVPEEHKHLISVDISGMTPTEIVKLKMNGYKLRG